MVIEVKYSCGCSYLHWDVAEVQLSHACDKHKKEIIMDRFKELAP